jgi:histidine kinase 2/3/4 (cytokinin receptor)
MVNRRVASSMLSRYGASVTTVDGGVEAVTAVRNQKEGHEFDLVLMDIQMPEVSTNRNDNFLLWVFHHLIGF